MISNYIFKTISEKQRRKEKKIDKICDRKNGQCDNHEYENNFLLSNFNRKL